MRDEVYEFLREYGFTKEEVYGFEEKNEKMFFTNLVEVNKNIDFLINKGLNKEEIMYVFKHNPFMITVKNNRLEMLDKIYLEDLSLDLLSLKNIIIKNTHAYTASPIELNKNIEYLKDNNYNIDIIKNIFMNNPEYVSMRLEDFKNIVKFN